MDSADRPLVGVVPCGGRATRLGRLPCSKEILPVAPGAPPGTAAGTASEELLQAMRRGGAELAYLVLGTGKWDIPAYLDDGSCAGIPLAYLTIRDSSSAVETIDRAYPFVRDAVVLLGFPDILFEPADAFARLVARLDEGGGDVVLGVFPAERPERVDMVEHEPDGRVRRILVKPAASELTDAWILAAWRPSFTAFLHEHSGLARDDREPYPGDVLQHALESGLRVDSVDFPEGRFRDLGTPEDLAAAVRERYASGPRPTPA